MNIVLHEPEIPQNTGNIGRTCVSTDTKLHLIRPLGFDIGEKTIKRAGLDYWHNLNLTVYDDFEDFCKKNPNIFIFPATTKAKKLYTEVNYPSDAFIMFGKESAGLPAYIRDQYSDNCIRIPMTKDNRSLNLANSVAIVLYEALRQNNFPTLN